MGYKKVDQEPPEYDKKILVYGRIFNGTPKDWHFGTYCKSKGKKYFMIGCTKAKDVTHWKDKPLTPTD